MRKALIFLSAVVSVSKAPAFPNFDPFADATASGGTSYTLGANLIGQTNALGETWYVVGSVAPQPYITNGLTYPGLPASTGNAAAFPIGAGSTSMSARYNIDKAGGAVNSGSIYFSFILKITDISALSSNGVFWAGWSDTAGGQSASLSRCGTRVYTRKVGASYQLGVAKNSSTATDWVFESGTHNEGDVLFVVGSYDGLGGTTSCSMWINPDSSTFGSNAPPTPPLTATTGADLNGTPPNVRAFVLCVRSTSQPAGIIDELRIGKTWASVTGGPDITTQPTNQTRNAGTSATFSVRALGGPPLSYQWSRNAVPLTDGVNVSGATTANLTLSNLLASNTANYAVTITNAYASTTSSTATLTVNDPAVNTQPASTNVPPGATATFSVVAGGTPTLSYQWIKNDTNLLVNGTNISGANSPTLTITNVSPSDAGNYTVAVTNGLNNSVISAPAVMTVIDPAITTEPQSRTNDYGTTATFSVSAAGTGPFTYQWLRSGTNLSNGGNVSGVASATLGLTAVSYLDAGSYSVIVSNSLGNSVTSSTVTLTVKDPIITAQPSSKIAIGGTTTSFTVGAAGSSLSFIWKKGTAVLSNGGNISGANTATLMISALSATDPANYSVMVSNPASGQTVTSSTVNLSVVNPLTPRTVAVGDTIVFAPLVTGTPPFTYQWTKAGSPIAGQTSTSYTKSNVQVSDSDTYAVGVTNPAGSVTVSAALIVSATGLNLNPTNLIVLRQGDGIQAIANTGNTLFLDQFTTSGTYVNTVSIPDSGPSALIQNGTAPTEGYINLSLNRGVLTLVGFNVTRPWTSGLGNTASVDVPRAIATVDAAANYTLVVSSTNGFSGNNIRSAITDGANNYWVSGGGSGTRYFRPGSADNVSIQTTINNTRVLQIFNGDLYFSAAATSWGIHKFAGLPTAAAAESDVLLTGNNTSSPYDYVLDSSGTNMYLTEDGSASTNIYVPGIVKWTYNTGTATWNSNYTLLPGTGTRGLTADLKVNPPVLYVTTTNGGNDIANRLLAVQDTGPSAAATLLATAGPNQAFKGVRFGPLPVISATPDGARVILRWNGAYTLQSATNALGPYSDIPSATSPYTNSAYSPIKRFFRLRQ